MAPGPAHLRERQEGVQAYLGAIRHHPLLVAGITLAAVAASVAFLLLRSPTYEATADLLVDPVAAEDENFTGLPLLRETGDPARTVQTAASLVEGQAIADRTAEKLGGEWTGEDVVEAIEVETRGESNVLAVTASAESPQEAARIANTFTDVVLQTRRQAVQGAAREAIDAVEARLDEVPNTDPVGRAELTTRREQLQSLLNDGDPTLVRSQEATPPPSASGTPPAVIIAVALLAGLAIGCGTAMLREVVTRQVRDETDALMVYPMPVLARIPELRSRKLRGYGDGMWHMEPEVRQRFGTLAAQLEAQGRRKGALMVTSASAGDGKTTSAINLAVTLGTMHKSVVLLDFDVRHPQIASALKIGPAHPIEQVLIPPENLEQLLIKPWRQWPLRVLPIAPASDPRLIELANPLLPGLLERARELADFVVVDTGPLGEVGDALRLVNEVDELLVVVRPGNTYYTHLETLRDLLDRVGGKPMGYITIGRSEGPTSSYYYDYAQMMEPGRSRGNDSGREAPPFPAEAPQSRG